MRVGGSPDAAASPGARHGAGALVALATPSVAGKETCHVA
jgi:hypothetical protein